MKKAKIRREKYKFLIKTIYFLFSDINNELWLRTLALGWGGTGNCCISTQGIPASCSLVVLASGATILPVILLRG